jgi:hypothetical protein
MELAMSKSSENSNKSKILWVKFDEFVNQNCFQVDLKSLVKMMVRREGEERDEEPGWKIYE